MLDILTGLVCKALSPDEGSGCCVIFATTSAMGALTVVAGLGVWALLISCIEPIKVFRTCCCGLGLVSVEGGVSLGLDLASDCAAAAVMGEISSLRFLPGLVSPKSRDSTLAALALFCAGLACTSGLEPTAPSVVFGKTGSAINWGW